MHTTQAGDLVSHRACGLDFGTSNSTLGVMQEGRATLLPLEGDKVTLPSAIFFNFEENTTHYGRRAIQNYTEGTEGRLMRALKSVLGTSLIHETTRIKSRQLAFTDILGAFLGHMKTQAERTVGHGLSHVVLGRPVHFVDDDPKADAEAQNQLELTARAQGFQHIAFQFEPIAAALDYEQQVQREQLAFIVDIGGGTSDFSIVRVSPERARAADRKADILANAGVHIGGTDFDRLLSLAHMMPHLGLGSKTLEKGHELPTRYYYDLASWPRIHGLYNRHTLYELRQLKHEAAQPALIERLMSLIEHRLGHALAGKVEEAKIRLTAQPEALIELPLHEAPLHVHLTRPALEESLMAAVERITRTVGLTLTQAHLRAEQVQAVFLTGGSTQIPVVKQSILSLFPAAHVVEGDMFGSVGLGLTLDAQRKFA